MSRPTKLTVGSTFPIHPPRSGGQLRIFELYRRVAADFPVDVIALAQPHEPTREHELAPGLHEVLIPRSEAHARAEANMQGEAGLPIGDIAFTQLHGLTPAFANAVRSSAEPGGVLVASHPYALPALSSACATLPVWYDAHNVEVDLKRSMLEGTRSARRLLAATRHVERAACRRSELVFASCSEDAARLRRLYRVPVERLLVVPNGIDTAGIDFVDPGARRELRLRLRLGSPLALFIGSWHEPNVEAARRVLALASRLPAVQFAIAGSVGMALRDEPTPSNVELFGVIDDELKRTLLAVASVALNPMSAGSGTNMKMLDYLAAGLPAVTTPVGARGLDLDLERHLQIASLEGFAEAVQELLDQPPEVLAPRVAAARGHVEDRFDWSRVASRLLERGVDANAVAATRRALV